ncbi:MAG: hypothetical protein JWO06_2360, partial [Bacteroidota bacterium]|nr:hypothetical protein [Bacteroidota bacterium]
MKRITLITVSLTACLIILLLPA